MATNRFKSNEPQYQNSAAVSWPVPTNTTPELIDCAVRATEQIYQKGYRYKKAGINLIELSPATSTQRSLFDAPERRERMKRVMEVMDAVNQTHGAGTLRYAVSGLRQGWKTQAEKRSPRYTTRWDELMLVD